MICWFLFLSHVTCTFPMSVVQVSSYHIWLDIKHSPSSPCKLCEVFFQTSILPVVAHFRPCTFYVLLYEITKYRMCYVRWWRHCNVLLCAVDTLLCAVDTLLCAVDTLLCAVDTLLCAVDTLPSLTNLDDIDDDELRGLMSPHASHILKSWLFQHMLVCRSFSTHIDCILHSSQSQSIDTTSDFTVRWLDCCVQLSWCAVSLKIRIIKHHCKMRACNWSKSCHVTGTIFVALNNISLSHIALPHMFLWALL